MPKLPLAYFDVLKLVVDLMMSVTLNALNVSDWFQPLFV